MKYCYVIGDSFFSAEPNNWLEQGIPEDYTVVNQAIGATGFWRQLQQVKDLCKSPHYNDIEYCIVGWSHPFRIYAPEYARDWKPYEPMSCDEQFFKTTNTVHKDKRLAVANAIKHDILNEKRECEKALDLLFYVDLHLYKKMNHIKFINFFCFDWDFASSVDDFYFTNGITVKPNFFKLTTAHEPNPDKRITADIPNHFTIQEHKMIGEKLNKILTGKTDTVVWLTK